MERDKERKKEREREREREMVLNPGFTRGSGARDQLLTLGITSVCVYVCNVCLFACVFVSLFVFAPCHCVVCVSVSVLVCLSVFMHMYVLCRNVHACVSHVV